MKEGEGHSRQWGRASKGGGWYELAALEQEAEGQSENTRVGPYGPWGGLFSSVKMLRGVEAGRLQFLGLMTFMSRDANVCDTGRGAGSAEPPWRPGARPHPWCRGWRTLDRDLGKRSQ